jgi:hypothetical protein
MMNAAFVPNKRDRDHNENHNQYDALLIFREFENPEEAFHFLA